MLLPAVVWWPCGAVSCGAVRCGVVVPCDGGERLRLQITEGSTIIIGGHMSSGLVWSVSPSVCLAGHIAVWSRGSPTRERDTAAKSLFTGEWLVTSSTAKWLGDHANRMTSADVMIEPISNGNTHYDTTSSCPLSARWAARCTGRASL